MSNRNEPLAFRMSPRTLDEYVGQKHIIGEGKLLRRIIEADRLSSIILFGPPGTGKTALARLIALRTASEFVKLNAVTAGVADIKKVITDTHNPIFNAKGRTVLFIDEIHRFNKLQQDALLPHVEDGTIILIGATTENPFFEVNKAVISRSTVLKLEPLENDDIIEFEDRIIQVSDIDKNRVVGIDIKTNKKHNIPLKNMDNIKLIKKTGGKSGDYMREETGKVLSINISEKKGVIKESIDVGIFIENHGLENDAHSGNWHRQVSLLGIESFEKMKEEGIEDLKFGSQS